MNRVSSNYAKVLIKCTTVYAFQQFVHRIAENEIERVIDDTHLQTSKGSCPGSGVIPLLWIMTTTLVRQAM